MQQEQLQDQLYDIYGVIYQPFWQGRWFFWMSILSTIAVLAIFIFFIFRWWLNRKSKLTYWQQALHELACLYAEIEDANRESDYIYKEMMRILKEYCSVRYEQNMQSCTDDEFIIQLQEYVPSDQLEPLRQLIPRAVEVKFAGEKAAQRIMLEDALHLHQFIKKTVPSKKK